MNKDDSRRPRILIVDDEKTNQVVLQHSLKNLDCDLDTCSSGLEAIDHCKENLYALILLDIMMPKLNGYETLVRIKEKTQNKHTPVFIITGMDSDQKTLLNAYNAGAVDFIEKPINPKILFRKSEHFLEFYHSKERLVEEKMRVENLMKSRMIMMANITHEIRSPLFAMIGMVDMLESLVEEVKSLEMIHKVQKNCDHLLDIVNSFLDYTKFELTGKEVSQDKFDIVQLCTEIVDILSFQQNKTENVSLNMEFDKKIPNLIMTDKKKVRHILINLISNALKFTPEGIVKLTAALESQNVLRLSIQDTGVGIAKNDLEKLFNKFSQVGNEEQEAQGTGLGLSISSTMAKTLRSEIQVVSKENIGSTFTLLLPFEFVENQAEYSSLPVQSIDSERIDKKLKILIVDDVFDNIFVIRSYLKNNNVEIDDTTDPLIANKLLAEGGYDICLLDINMPGRTGPEIVREHKKLESHSTYVVALTANILTDVLKQQYILDGFDSSLSKPIRRRELVDFLVAYSKEETVVPGSKDYVGEVDSFGDLPDDLKSYLPRYLDDKIKVINQVITDSELGELSELEAICHKILGTAPTFGLNGLNSLIEKLQAYALSNDANSVLKTAKETLSYLEKTSEVVSN